MHIWFWSSRAKSKHPQKFRGLEIDFCAKLKEGICHLTYACIWLLYFCYVWCLSYALSILEHVSLISPILTTMFRDLLAQVLCDSKRKYLNKSYKKVYT